MKLGQILAVNYLRARLNLLAVVSKKRAAAKAFDIFCTPFYRSKKSTPPIFKKAEAISLTVQGNMVRGFKWNKGGSERILILHGFESSSKNFETYIEELIRKNYEVLAFDAPAHGISGGRRITLALYVYMIESVYFKFGGIQGMIAHSFGGLAAAHAVEKLPGNENIRLALIAPATESVTAISSFFRFLQLGDAVRVAFDNIIRETSGVDAAWWSIPRALQQVKGPVLWVHDRQDDITPMTDVEPVRKGNYRNLRFYITDGLGHKKIYRDARVIREVVDFFSEPSVEIGTNQH